MKKYILLGCLIISFTNAMENSNKSCMYNETTIMVTKDCIVDRDKKVDAIIVGRNAQEKLQKDGKWIHVLYRVQERTHLYIKNKDLESTSHDITWKPYTSVDDGQWRNAYSKKMDSKIITISEPCIRKSDKYSYNEGKQMFLQGYCYAAKKENEFEMRGDEALTQALKDLYVCYKIALREVFKKLSGTEKKKIACLPLGIKVGIPVKEAAAMAAKAIFDFTQDNKVCEYIEFCVENQYEFDVYSEEFLSLVRI